MVKEYFEKHPKVKKALKITAQIGGAALTAYAAYKTGSYISGKKEKTALPIPEIPELKDEIEEVVEGLITAPDKHTFDMIFVDKEDGTKYVAPDSCLGSYVNDMMCGLYFYVEDPE